MKRLVLAAALVCSSAFAAPPVHTQQFLSKVYTIDRKYRSMEGPSSVERITLGDASKAELLWIVGIKTEMVGADGTSPQLPELMCHVNVDLDPLKHQALFEFQRMPASRLMTLSQGMLDAKLPEGFGFPIASNEALSVFTQVLNHNIEHPNNLQVRHRVTFTYLRDAELSEPIKPLFNVGASGMVQLDNNPIALKSMMPSMTDGMQGMEEHTGANCIVGSRAPQAAASAADYVDPTGRKMTGHWTVPPGRQVNASDITWFMQLPYDTKVHYAAFHLHPFAESLSIRDNTAGGETIMKAGAQNPTEGVGLMHVDTVSSVAGIPLLKNHKYDLVSVYNNTSGANADSMASVFLGLDDPEFLRPEADHFAKRASAILDSTTVSIRTTAGDLKAHMMRDIVPLTSLQVARLVQNGAFDHAKISDARSFLKIATPATQSVMLMLQAQTEHGPNVDRGTVVYCPPDQSGEVSLRVIVNPSAPLDARCIAFARLVDGMEIVDAITKAPVALTASVKGASMAR
jgi:hypothetical protein